MAIPVGSLTWGVSAVKWRCGSLVIRMSEGNQHYNQGNRQIWSKTHIFTGDVLRGPRCFLDYIFASLSWFESRNGIIATSHLVVVENVSRTEGITSVP
jgi:hypothetical protein